MDDDREAREKRLKELQKQLHEYCLKHPIKFFGRQQPELTPEQKEENRIQLAHTALLADAEDARRAKMTQEERDAEDAEEDRLIEESEAEFEAIQDAIWKDEKE